MSRRKLAQFKLILKELLVRGKNYRFLPLHNSLKLKFVNSKPEIRFRVSRPCVRKVIRRMIKQQLAKASKKEDAPQLQKPTRRQTKKKVVIDEAKSDEGESDDSSNLR